MNNDTKHEVEQVKAQQDGWIPVSERLPEEDQPVLAYRIEQAGEEYDVMWQHNSFWFGSGDDYATEPTHWMPLPSAPEDEP